MRSSRDNLDDHDNNAGGFAADQPIDLNALNRELANVESAKQHVEQQMQDVMRERTVINKEYQEWQKRYARQNTTVKGAHDRLVALRAKHEHDASVEAQLQTQQELHERLAGELETMRNAGNRIRQGMNDLLGQYQDHERQLVEAEKQVDALHRRIFHAKETQFKQACSQFRAKLDRLPDDAPEPVTEFYESGEKLLLSIKHDFRESKRDSAVKFDYEKHTSLITNASDLLDRPGDKVAQKNLTCMYDREVSGRASIGKMVLGGLMTFLGCAAMVASSVFVLSTGGLSLAGVGAGYLLAMSGMGMFRSGLPSQTHKKAHRFGSAASEAPDSTFEYQEEQRNRLVSVR